MKSKPAILSNLNFCPTCCKSWKYFITRLHPEARQEKIRGFYYILYILMWINVLKLWSLKCSLVWLLKTVLNPPTPHFSLSWQRQASLQVHLPRSFSTATCLYWPTAFHRFMMISEMRQGQLLSLQTAWCRVCVKQVLRACAWSGTGTMGLRSWAAS